MQTQTAIPTVLPPIANLNPQQTAKRSLVHWGWTAYKTINNMAPWGINSQLGYNDQRWTELKRCTPYPFKNLITYTPDRSVPGTSTSVSLTQNSDSLPKIEEVKYALDQVEELRDSYQDVGFRILTPLTGMDDVERVNQIVLTVQPYEYAIHEMAAEFTQGAAERIADSNLSAEDRNIAAQLARVMLDGSQSALKKAEAEYETLISSMSDKMAGQPGISNPTDFHKWICEQISKPVPAQIDRTGGQQTDALKMLAESLVKNQNSEAITLELQKERQARSELEERLAKLEQAQTAKAK